MRMTQAELFNWLDEIDKAIRTRTARGAITTTDLLALAPQNDPFAVGQEARVDAAIWFGELWKQYGRPGMHLRGFHYVLVSRTPAPTLANGMPYENTDECWTKLLSGLSNARCALAVDPGDFVERRTDEATVHATARDVPSPSVTVQPEIMGRLPSTDHVPWLNIPCSLTAPVTLEVPSSFDVSGYDYADADQPFTVELWVEKSTMNDVLEPLCEEWGMNLVAGKGFSSITRVIELLRDRADKPIRIFYISDFDPAGERMPAAVARSIEFFRQLYAPDTDIKLTPLALTAAQVQQYNLPRTPIKESDRRKAGFEQRHDVGATELDALEALYPGELESVIHQAVAPYFDSTLARRLVTAERQAKADARRDWLAATATERERLDALGAQADAIRVRHADAVRKELAPITEQIDAITARHGAEMDQELAPITEAITAVQDAINTAAEQFEPTLPPRPTPNVSLPDESDWLFDASRDYFEQIDHYKNSD